MPFSIWQRCAMVLGGVILFVILPRDPWPVSTFAVLFVSAAVASVFVSIWRGVLARPFRWTVLTTTLLFLGALFLADLSQTAGSERQVGQLLMWLPLLVLFGGLYSLAAALTVFPILGPVGELVRRHRDRSSQ